MPGSTTRTDIPRSMRQKRVLDVASARPEASVEAIASEVPSVTPEFVEEVLDTYGDPADTPSEPTAEEELSMSTSDSKQKSDPDEPPDPEELTPRQRTILRTIVDHPNDTQREIAGRLDVSAPTISNRVNSIDGFAWCNRANFAAAVLESKAVDGSTNEAATEEGGERNESQTQQLLERVADLEDQLERLPKSRDDTNMNLVDDASLAHKLVHACINSDMISEEEELAIIESLL